MFLFHCAVKLVRLYQPGLLLLSNLPAIVVRAENHHVVRLRSAVYYVAMILVVLLSGWTHAANDVEAEEDPALDVALQALKKEVLSLNRDLFILEEELMFPANTQVAVYLSLDIGDFFSLDSVTLKMNNREVASHLYTDRQLDALARGGVQRLFLGNLRSGEHELMAVFTGRGPNGRDYRRATSLEFTKDSKSKKLELVIRDEKKNYQPDFSIVEWQ